MYRPFAFSAIATAQPGHAFAHPWGALRGVWMSACAQRIFNMPDQIEKYELSY
jgi:hypothetical protein